MSWGTFLFMPLRRAPVPTPASIDVTVKKAGPAFTVVQTSRSSAQLVFTSEEAAKAAADKTVLTVNRLNANSNNTTTEMKIKDAKVNSTDKNVVDVSLYANLMAKTEYTVSYDGQTQPLSVGDLTATSIKFGIKDNATPIKNVKSAFTAFTYCTDANGNLIKLDEVTTATTFTLAKTNSNDARIDQGTANSVNGQGIIISKTGVSVEVKAKYGKLEVTNYFEAVDPSVYTVASVAKYAVLNATAHKDTQWTADWKSNGEALELRKLDEAKLGVIVKGSNGRYVANYENDNVGTANDGVTSIGSLKYVSKDLRTATLTYKSTDTDVVLINAEGILTAVNPGNATIEIYATTVYGGVKEQNAQLIAYIPVVVGERRQLTSIVAENDNYNSLNEGEFVEHTTKFTGYDQDGYKYTHFTVVTDSTQTKLNKTDNVTMTKFDYSTKNGATVSVKTAVKEIAPQKSYTATIVFVDDNNPNDKFTNTITANVFAGPKDAGEKQTGTNTLITTYADQSATTPVTWFYTNDVRILFNDEEAYDYNLIDWDNVQVVSDKVIKVVEYYAGLPWTTNPYAYSKDGSIAPAHVALTNLAVKTVDQNVAAINAKLASLEPIYIVRVTKNNATLSDNDVAVIRTKDATYDKNTSTASTTAVTVSAYENDAVKTVAASIADAAYFDATMAKLDLVVADTGKNIDALSTLIGQYMVEVYAVGVKNLKGDVVTTALTDRLVAWKQLYVTKNTIDGNVSVVYDLTYSNNAIISTTISDADLEGVLKKIVSGISTANGSFYTAADIINHIDFTAFKTNTYKQYYALQASAVSGTNKSDGIYIYKIPVKTILNDGSYYVTDVEVNCYVQFAK